LGRSSLRSRRPLRSATYWSRSISDSVVLSDGCSPSGFRSAFKVYWAERRDLRERAVHRLLTRVDGQRHLMPLRHIDQARPGTYSLLGELPRCEQPLCCRACNQANYSVFVGRSSLDRDAASASTRSAGRSGDAGRLSGRSVARPGSITSRSDAGNDANLARHRCAVHRCDHPLQAPTARMPRRRTCQHGGHLSLLSELSRRGEQNPLLLVLSTGERVGCLWAGPGPAIARRLATVEVGGASLTRSSLKRRFLAVRCRSRSGLWPTMRPARMLLCSPIDHPLREWHVLVADPCDQTRRAPIHFWAS